MIVQDNPREVQQKSTKRLKSEKTRESGMHNITVAVSPETYQYLDGQDHPPKRGRHGDKHKSRTLTSAVIATPPLLLQPWGKIQNIIWVSSLSPRYMRAMRCQIRVFLLPCAAGRSPLPTFRRCPKPRKNRTQSE